MAALTLAVALHALLGVALAALVWIVGLGYLAASSRRRVSAHEAVDAYPIGLLVVVAAAVAVLLDPWLGIVSAGLLVGGIWQAIVHRAWFGAAPVRAAAVAAAALPAAVGYGAVLGFLQHGPTGTLDSASNGELQFYVMKLVSATQSIAPYRDLLVEGQGVIYPEAAPSFVGAVLAHAPGLDAFLFHTTALGVFMVVSLVVGLRLMTEASPEVALDESVVVAGLVLASLTYPSWIVESPPVALAAPLGFAVYRLVADELSPRRLGVLTALLLASLLLTKVVAAIPLGVVVALLVIRRIVARPDPRRILAYATALGAAAAVAVTFLFLGAGWYADLVELEFLPADTVRGLLENGDRQHVAVAVLSLGEAALALLLLRMRAFALSAALVVSVGANWVVGGYGFDIAVGVAILLAALELHRRPEAVRSHRLVAISAAALLAVSVWLRDLHGLRAGLVLTLLAAWAILLAVTPAVRRPAAYASVLVLVAASVLLALANVPALALLAVAGLAALAVVAPRRVATVLPAAAAVAAAVAVAIAIVRADDLALTNRAAVLTPADHDVWQAVEDLTPRDALVFTSLTGREVEPHQGWNNYPAISERQVYLAGWYDGRLVARPDELEQRLARNELVLAGRAAPDSVGLERTYDGYYAVLRLNDPAPASFTRLYANDAYALYRLRS